MKVNDKKVYIMFTDNFINVNTIKLIEKGRSLGKVIVGVPTDEAFSDFYRLPEIKLEERINMIKSVKGVSQVIAQKSIDGLDNLVKLKPDIVILLDNFKVGLFSIIRKNIIDTISSWNGKLLEIPSQGLNKKTIYNTPDYRRAKLKRMIISKPYVTAMEASNGMSGLIVENTKIEDFENRKIKEFDCMWVSSLCDSTFKGKPDIELVDLTSRINTLNEIIEVTTKPIIFDGDTGGKIEHFVYTVKSLERLGVSAIVIEDKKGLKQNSLFGTEVKQQLEDPNEFALKIKAGKSAQVTDDFMIFARIESLIANVGIDDALNRAKVYIENGADGIVIHSKEKDGNEIFQFLNRFREKYKDVPVILIPTTYNQYTEEQLCKHGANIIIYANHLLRSAYPAMVNTAKMILEDGNSKRASETNCMSIKEVINLVPGGKKYD